MALRFGVYYDPKGMGLEDSACSLEVFCSAADGAWFSCFRRIFVRLCRVFVFLV